MKSLKLNQLNKTELKKREMEALRGGKEAPKKCVCECSCSSGDCACEKSGGTVCGVNG